MQLEDYVRNYNNAPYPLEEYAEGAIGVTDSKELQHAADLYIDAVDKFKRALDNVNVEVG